MFSFLKNGDIHNTIRELTNLPGLVSSDSSKIKYTLLDYSTVMRGNLTNGNPIFHGISKPEEEIELANEEAATATETAPATATDNNDADYDYDYDNDEEMKTPLPARTMDFSNKQFYCENAVLSEIFAKELAFLNRTIQMISLVAGRYHEEQEDNEWGRCDNGDDIESGTGTETGYYVGDDYIEDDSVPSVLERTHSSSSSSSSSSHTQNQLANTLLIGSGQLQQHFFSLCVLAEIDIVLVNAMTTLDRPLTESSIMKQQRAHTHVVSSIYTHFCRFDAEHRAPVVRIFQTLRDISSAAWGMMSLLAYSNLFRLTRGTDFEISPINPDEAIFPNHGRPFRPRMGTAATIPENWAERWGGGKPENENAVVGIERV